MHRIGFGFDAHRFEEGRKLIIGGVEIPHEEGLSGHSDADVLTHAICDALLGALGLGDIGSHFPDSDPKWKDISSLVLLKETLAKMNEAKYEIQNIDSTIVCEKPRISPHIRAIKEKLSAITRLEPGALGIKATTTDGMGFTGRGEGIAAYAVVIIKSSGT
jgi:2-C-methyl-D-erythritol 2,4-cyclodiphosphate synthase